MKVRMYGCNLYLLLINECMLGKPGASMYGQKQSSERGIAEATLRCAAG
jgi:hypothetical protein